MEARQAKHDEALRQWDERLLRFQEETGQCFTTLVDVSMSLANNLQTLGEETNRRFQGTDCKLNALINTIDKLVKRNGSRQ